MFTGVLNRWKERKKRKQSEAKQEMLTCERRLVDLAMELEKEREFADAKQSYIGDKNLMLITKRLELVAMEWSMAAKSLVFAGGVFNVHERLAQEQLDGVLRMSNMIDSYQKSDPFYQSVESAMFESMKKTPSFNVDIMEIRNVADRVKAVYRA